MGVDLTMSEGVATIRVDDGKANAFTHDLLAELRDALDAAEADARAVIVQGRAGRFSAGFDLATMRSGDEAMRALVGDGIETLLRLFESQLPVVAACTGHALAYGGLLLLVADRRVGAFGEYRIGLNEVAIGLALLPFIAEFARYRLAPSHLDSVLFGETFGPGRALELGYLDAVVPADQVEGHAHAVAVAAAGLDRAAFGATKRALRAEAAGRIRASLAADLSSLTLPPAG